MAPLHGYGASQPRHPRAVLDECLRAEHGTRSEWREQAAWHRLARDVPTGMERLFPGRAPRELRDQRHPSAQLGHLVGKSDVRETLWRIVFRRPVEPRDLEKNIPSERR